MREAVIVSAVRTAIGRQGDGVIEISCRSGLIAGAAAEGRSACYVRRVDRTGITCSRGGFCFIGYPTARGILLPEKQ